MRSDSESTGGADRDELTCVQSSAPVVFAAVWLVIIISSEDIRNSLSISDNQAEGEKVT